MSQAVKNNQYSPGKHLLLDFSGAKYLTDIEHIKKALQKAAQACGASILEIKLHSFGKNDGVTGIALLAESHISIHTWPEINFAALDVFMCGDCDASLSIKPLKEMFEPTKVNITEIKRGNGKI
jgi:S-adenosylmethionine decarboxylase